IAILYRARILTGGRRTISRPAYWKAKLKGNMAKPATVVHRELIVQQSLASTRQEDILRCMREGEVDTETGQYVHGALWWVWNCTETFDEHWTAKGLKSPYSPFPRLPYLPWLFYRLATC